MFVSVSVGGPGSGWIHGGDAEGDVSGRVTHLVHEVRDQGQNGCR